MNTHIKTLLLLVLAALSFSSCSRRFCERHPDNAHCRYCDYHPYGIFCNCGPSGHVHYRVRAHYYHQAHCHFRGHSGHPHPVHRVVSHSGTAHHR